MLFGWAQDDNHTIVLTQSRGRRCAQVAASRDRQKRPLRHLWLQPCRNRAQHVAPLQKRPACA